MAHFLAHPCKLSIGNYPMMMIPTVPLLAAICGKDESLLRRVYPGILSKAVESVGGEEASEFGDAVLTVFKTSESDEDSMRFLLIEQVRNVYLETFMTPIFFSLIDCT